MNALSVFNVSASVKDHSLFSEVSFGLEEGEKLGIIGKNGAGKTTFLRLLSSQLVPDEGTITFNSSLKIGYLEQDPQLSDENKDNYEFKRYLSEMGGDTQSISGGNRKKIAIALLLSKKPDILLLDEPTNHLDIRAVEFLEGYLKDTNKTVILVTHDRYFLDRICSKIMEIDRCRAYFYNGGYTSFLEGREERINSQNKEQERLSSILRRELEWLHRGPKARTGKDSSRKMRIEQMQSSIEEKQKEERSFSSIQRRLGKKILSLENVSISRGGKQILKDFSLEFIKGQRFGVTGPNGSGKSTLLELLTGNLLPESGIIDTGVNTVFGYYDQNSVNLPLEKTPVEFFEEIGQSIILSKDYSVSPARFLELFGFPSSFHRLPISVLSGGEKRRLYLLSTLVKNPNFLVLDEPTNDLDIETLRRLEQYILDFSGCVISVSHDRAFLDRTCTELIIMPEAQRFEGTYSEYHEEEKKSRKEVQKGRGSKEKNRQEKKGLTFKENREFEALTVKIEELETEKKDLEDFFSSSIPDTTGEKAKRYKEIEAELTSSYLRWEELASKI